jgi:RNA polymerase sigma-70 factor (family 1)
MVRLKHCDDEELLSLIRKCNYNAFDEVYNRYWRKLFRIAFKKTGCKDDAMDLVQDLFIELWRRKDRLNITSSLNTYLISCLYYKVFYHFKIKGLQEKHIQTFHDFLHQGKAADSEPVSAYQKELEYEQIQELINQTIEEMPDKMRRVFQMTRTGDHSVSEVAAALNISPQTVKNQTFIAKTRLRKVINEQYAEIPLSMLIVLLINH